MPRWPRGVIGLAAVRDDELVLDMLRTLPVLPTLQLKARDADAGLPHPTRMRPGRMRPRIIDGAATSGQRWN